MYTFTVFTPTFNRAHTLPRVYDSLCRQTFKDFEWLVVDDGSTDGTPELIDIWRRERRLGIQYVRQPNSGKHVAVNRGVQAAKGELFVFLDSDDACVPTALERLRAHWLAIPEGERGGFSAVTALAQDEQGNVIGSRFPHDPTDSDSLEIKYRYGVTGEKWGFQRTDVLRALPYPVFPGEKAMPESLLWNRIARRYKTRYVNEPLEIYVAAPDGWGARSTQARSASPRGTQLYFRELLSFRYPMTFLTRLRETANYVRFSLHLGLSPAAQIAQVPSVRDWVLSAPIGLLAYARDRHVVRKATRDRMSLAPDGFGAAGQG